MSFVVKVNREVLLDSEPHGFMFGGEGKLESALGRPMHTYFGEPLYPTVVERAAALLEGVAQAHAFHEGNKRTAWTSMNTYLTHNEYMLRPMDAETSGGMLLRLVNHEIDLREATIWIASRLS